MYVYMLHSSGELSTLENELMVATRVMQKSSS